MFEVIPGTEVWSDYGGASVYGDFDTNGGSPIELRSYQAGIASVEQWTSAGASGTKYTHMDMLGSSRASSEWLGSGSYNSAYTAFGETMPGSASGRFGFAGAWGYQAHGEFDSFHVGARYYDPKIGRFLQRDPSGIAGGANVYAYVFNLPTRGIDPTGKGFFDGNNGFHNWFANNFWRSIHSDSTLANMSNARAILEGVVAPAAAVVGAAVAGVALASGGATASLSVGTGRAGIHFAVSSSTAGAWHYIGPAGSLIAVQASTSQVGTRLLTLPARYPNAIRNMPDGAMNCFTGALRGFLGAL